MKALFIFLISINIFYGQGLESFLSTGAKTLNEQKKEPKYFIIKPKKELMEVKESKPRYNYNNSIYDGENQVKGNKLSNQIKSNIYGYKSKLEKEEKEKNKYKKRTTEEIISDNFEIPEKYKRYEIHEKVIISFDIDEKKNISNIIFLKPSSYEEINKSFEKAIIKSNQELRAPAKKETKTLYYEFDI